MAYLMLTLVMLSTIIFFFILKFLINFVYDLYHYKDLISKLPGPKRGTLKGNLTQLLCDKVTFFKKLRKWSRKYYPCYDLAAMIFDSVNISGADEFEDIAATMKNIQKSIIYRLLDNWLGEGLLTSTGEKWQMRRKILTPAFHFGILQGFVKIFNKESNKLVEDLKPYQGQKVNVVPFISLCTLKSVAETSMGTALDINYESDKKYISSIQEMGKIFFHRLVRPWLYAPPIHYYFTPKGFTERGLTRDIHDFTNKIIQEREETFIKNTKEIQGLTNDDYSSRKKKAMLDLLLSAKFGTGFIDNKGIQDEVNTFMFEGHDTTSMSICFTLMLLAHHRDVQDLVYQEMMEVFGEANTDPTLTQLNELKYMERVIKESLRLYPSVPFIGRILEEDIVTRSGFKLPKLAVVNIHIYDIHRDPKHWPDPEKFDPDRFLPENCVNRHPFAYVPFSAGPRNCIGQRFAILEIKSVLNSVLNNYILEAIDTPETVKLIPDMVLRTEDGSVNMNFLPRHKSK